MSFRINRPVSKQQKETATDDEPSFMTEFSDKFDTSIFKQNQTTNETKKQNTGGDKGMVMKNTMNEDLI